MSTPAVVLSGIERRHGEVRVVRGLDLTIQPGELVSLLGPSGCGKTTTLRMIAGLDAPDAGTLTLEGRVVDGPGIRVPPERRGLGMVFQSYAVWPHRSVFDNVAYPLALRRVPRAEIGTRVTEALGWVRMEAFAARMPHALSGGQLQRVALARALVGGPRVLLLDEPLSNLDAALREELRAEIAALRQRLGTTTLYVTHDQGEALALSDRVAVMRGGVLEQVDAPRRLYERPATAFVAAFVGGANLLPGAREGDAFVVEGGGRLGLPPGADVPSGRGTLVVRPEDLGLAAPAGPGGLPISARLFLGSSVEHRLTVGTHMLRAVGPADGPTLGDRAEVRLRRVRFFPG